MVRPWHGDREPTSLQALIVPASAIDEESAYFQAAACVCARNVFGQDGKGEGPPRRAVLPKVRGVPAEADFLKGVLSLIRRSTDDTERAVDLLRGCRYQLMLGNAHV